MGRAAMSRGNVPASLSERAGETQGEGIVVEHNSRVDMKIAHAVKEIRQAADLSQTELAARLGTTQPSVSAWERGETAPGFGDITNIEKACGRRRGAVFRLAGYAPEVNIPELLLTDPALGLEQRKIAADTYRVWVKMARSQRGQ